MTHKQLRAQYTQEFKMEAVRQVRAGQAIAVVAKVLGIPKASLGNWVRQSAKGDLSGAVLAGQDLSECRLEDCYLGGCDLTGASLVWPLFSLVSASANSGT